MTVSTDGQLCYGILLDDDTQFPWDVWDDVEEWWLYEICGYRPPFEIYNADGEYIEGVKPSKEKLREYYDPKYAFRKSHPLPIELVNYCSYDYPMYIITVSGGLVSARRGCPVAINPESLLISQDDRELLIQFCKDHDILTDQEPKWWLSSLWG